MYGIFITGTEMLSRIGTCIKEIWDNLNSKDEINYRKFPIEVPLIIKKAKLRRMSRYSYMGLYTTKSILDRREENFDSLDKENIGTIYNTAYGPLVTELKFGESVNKHDADFASPTLFSQTVFNTCVGNICINTGLKGPSTILSGSNNIGYSFELIKEGKADMIFTGGIEEYCEDLYECYMKKNEKRNDVDVTLSEASATVLLEKIDYSSDKMLQINNEIYCEMLGYKERNIGMHPLLADCNFKYYSDTFEKNMSRLMAEFNIKPEQIDMVVTTKCGYKNVDVAEDEAIEKLFGREICKVSPKMFIGETFGASLSSNVIIASEIMKYQKIPLKLCDNPCKEINYSIVNSYDVSGNLTSILLKKYNKGE